jgi:hypothetical protein
LTVEELAEWRGLFARGGYGALRATRLPDYRYEDSL